MRGLVPMLITSYASAAQGKWVSMVPCGTKIFPLHPSGLDQCVKPIRCSFFPVLSKTFQVIEENLHNGKPGSVDWYAACRQGTDHVVLEYCSAWGPFLYDWWDFMSCLIEFSNTDNFQRRGAFCLQSSLWMHSVGHQRLKLYISWTTYCHTVLFGEYVYG